METTTSYCPDLRLTRRPRWHWRGSGPSFKLARRRGRLSRSGRSDPKSFERTSNGRLLSRVTVRPLQRWNNYFGNFPLEGFPFCDYRAAAGEKAQHPFLAARSPDLLTICLLFSMRMFYFFHGQIAAQGNFHPGDFQFSCASSFSYGIVFRFFRKCDRRRAPLHRTPPSDSLADLSGLEFPSFFLSPQCI